MTTANRTQTLPKTIIHRKKKKIVKKNPEDCRVKILRDQSKDEMTMIIQPEDVALRRSWTRKKSINSTDSYKPKEDSIHSSTERRQSMCLLDNDITAKLKMGILKTLEVAKGEQTLSHTHASEVSVTDLAPADDELHSA